jgi:hypothetical protein
MSSRRGKKPIKKESNSDSDDILSIDDFIIVKKKAKMSPKDLTISQILYNIITSDFLKGLSQDMIKFAAMFLLTSYLRGEPLPLHLFNRAINQEVREASTAVDIATAQTQTDPQLYDEDDPEYRLPVMLDALREFEDRRGPETKTDIGAVEEEIKLDYNQIMEGFTGPEMGGFGLKKKLKGGGQGTRNAPRPRLARRTLLARPQLAEIRAEFQYDNISDIIAEAIGYARRNNIPSRVLRTVLEVLARAAVFLLIYEVIHVGTTSIQYLIDNYMDYKAMFTHYMAEYKKQPKTAKDISEDAEHYKSWQKENVGGKLPKDLKATETDEEIKEIEGSNWFKRFYRNTIKPTVKKMYDIATSDEAITAAKITAQILILSLLMYAANEAKGAMYNYIVSPVYESVMSGLNRTRADGEIIVDIPKKKALIDLIERYKTTSIDPSIEGYIRPKFNITEKRLKKMKPENRRLFFEANPESKFIRRFPTSSEIAIQTDPEESKEDFYIEMQRANEADEARDILDELADILDEPADIFSTTSVKEKAKAIQGKNPKPVAPTTERGTKGLGLSDHKNKFYEFIASKDAKNMAKTAALGLITTVLTILASQATSNKKITASTAMEIQPRQIDTDLSYYGIPN